MTALDLSRKTKFQDVHVFFFFYFEKKKKPVVKQILSEKKHLIKSHFLTFSPTWGSCYLATSLANHMIISRLVKTWGYPFHSHLGK